MKTKQPNTAQKPDLDPSEWDFRKEKVPDAKIETCFIYEHARELAKRSDKMKDLLAKWKAGRRARQTSSKYKEALRAHSELSLLLVDCFDTTVVLSNDFPETPWQKLDQTLRTNIVNGVNEGRLNAPDEPLAIRLLAKPTKDIRLDFRTFRAFHWFFWDSDLVQHGFIAVNWKSPDVEIRRAFDKWLQQRRPPATAACSSKVKKTRGGFRDKLNLLASLRLLDHYGPRRLLKDPASLDTHLRFADAPHHNLNDVYEAKARAEKLIKFLLTGISSFYESNES